jgi:uncharacterized membrane protein YGL010W
MASVSYRNCLYSYNRLIVIARNAATKQSHEKCLKLLLHIFRNEIATPFGLAMTVILGLLIYDTRH